MMPPSECPHAIVCVGRPDGLVEHVQGVNLVRESLLDRPAGAAYEDPASA